MKRMMLVLALMLAGAAVTAAAQARVGVSLGFTVPRLHGSGYVVIGRPHYHRPYHRYHYHARPPVIVVGPDVIVPPRRPIVVYRRSHRHHRYHHW